MLEVDLIAEYLLENSYVSSERDAYNLIPHMSDNWLGSLLESSDIQDLYERSEFKARKIGGVWTRIKREDTPLEIEVPAKTLHGKGIKSIDKDPETGNWNKPAVRMVRRPNPIVGFARASQGQNMSPDSPVSAAIRKKMTRRERHAQGGGKGQDRGYARGIRKNRNVTQYEKQVPETHPGTNITINSPAGRIYQARLDAEAKRASHAAQRNRYGNRR